MAISDYSTQKECKHCEKCGSEFFRNKNMSYPQFEKRRFCSKKCAAFKGGYDVESIISLYKSGKSSSEIGDAIGISCVHVRRILKVNDVEMRCASENKKLALNRPEVIEKIRKSATGRRLSEESKDKLRNRVGEKNHNWRNGLTINAAGYLVFTSSVANGEHAGRFLHQVIAEWKYDRKLEHKEHVHHVDGNKLNNDPDNLVILSASDHAKTHTQDRENGKRLK